LVHPGGQSITAATSCVEKYNMYSNRTFLTLVIVGLLAACYERSQPVDPIDAQFAASETQRALVIHKGETWWCGIADGNGEVVWPIYPVNIITHSHNGNAQHICHADGVANPTGRAIVWKPGDLPGVDVCGIVGVPGFELPDPEDITITNDWKQVISASGHATLTCHFNGKE
jgi:hypothetical protein